MTLLRMRKGLDITSSFIDEILASKTLLWVWVEPTIFHEAVQELKSHQDKRWSFTDCTSFTIMRQLGIKEAFGFDPNFEEAGFARLP